MSFDNLKLHLLRHHRVGHPQRQTFLLALIVVEFDRDVLLNKLMVQMQERVEAILTSEERNADEDEGEEPEEITIEGTPLVRDPSDDDLCEDLKGEILRQKGGTDQDLADMQQKIQQTLDSDSEDNEDDNDVNKSIFKILVAIM